MWSSPVYVAMCNPGGLRKVSDPVSGLVLAPQIRHPIDVGVRYTGRPMATCFWQRPGIDGIVYSAYRDSRLEDGSSTGFSVVFEAARWRLASDLGSGRPRPPTGPAGDPIAAARHQPSVENPAPASEDPPRDTKNDMLSTAAYHKQGFTFLGKSLSGS